MPSNYGFLNVDVKDLVREYDKQPGETGGSSDSAAPAAKKEEPAPEPSRAEEIASNEIGNESREREIRNAAKAIQEEEQERMQALADLNAGREKDAREKKEKIAPSEFQSAISAAVRASLVLDSAQRLVAINNQVNMRRGVAKEAGNSALKRTFAKGQNSTVKVPTQLLRSVAQTIGGLSSKTNQDLQMSGFLYWFFGRPAGVEFEPDQWDKINEIVENLDINASPARMAQAGANTSEAMLDKLDIMNQRMDGVAKLLQLLNKDILGVRTQTGKIYVADCYMVLNALMRTKPVPGDQRLEDVDMMSDGGYWGIDASITDTLEYVTTTNGRELYKAKHGIKAAPYKPPVPVQSDARVPAPAKAMYDPVDDIKPDDDQDDDYDDIPDDFDPLNDDFDDMGIGSDFNPAYMSDPDYDDGIEEGTPEYLQKMRQEALLKERAAKMVADQEWNDDDED